jgi:hypothetical protein
MRSPWWKTPNLRAADWAPARSIDSSLGSVGGHRHTVTRDGYQPRQHSADRGVADDPVRTFTQTLRWGEGMRDPVRWCASTAIARRRSGLVREWRNGGPCQRRFDRERVVLVRVPRVK